MIQRPTPPSLLAATPVRTTEPQCWLSTSDLAGYLHTSVACGLRSVVAVHEPGRSESPPTVQWLARIEKERGAGSEGPSGYHRSCVGILGRGLRGNRHDHGAPTQTAEIGSSFGTVRTVAYGRQLRGQLCVHRDHLDQPPHLTRFI